MNVLEGEFPEVRLQDPARRVPPRGGKAANGSARASRRVPHPRGGARSVAGSGGAPASNRARRSGRQAAGQVGEATRASKRRERCPLKAGSPSAKTNIRPRLLSSLS